MQIARQPTSNPDGTKDPFQLDFIGIGAAKAATTWLSECLREHPLVGVSIPKELSYFCHRPYWKDQVTTYHYGEAWLRKRFEHCAPGQILGEISPAYLVDPDSPQLIKAHNPAIKLIVNYRNPILCLYASYISIARQYAVPDTFEGFLDAYPDFMENCRFYCHTERYLDLFGAENLHTIVYDDVVSTPLRVVAETYRFLGVDDTYQPVALSQRVNQRTRPRSVFVRDLMAKITIFFRTNPRVRKLRDILNALGAAKLADYIRDQNLEVSPSTAMREETWRRLADVYVEDTRRLGKFLKRDLSHWSSPLPES